MAPSTITLIILAAAMVLYAIQAFPISVTSIFAVIALMVTNVITPKDAVSGFSNHVCWLIFGSGVMGAALFETGVANKIGESIMKCKPIIKSERIFLAVIVLAACIISIFVANVPVVALFMPIAAAVAAASDGKIQKKNLYMAIGFAATIGGNGSLIGSSINMTANALIMNTEGLRSLTMFECLPETLVMIAVLVVYYGTVGYDIQKRVFDFPEVEDVVDEGKTVEFKPVKAAIAVTVFALCIAGFVAGLYSFGTIALFGAAVVIATGCIPYKTALQKVDWTTIITLATVLVLANAVNSTGAGKMIADTIIGLFGGESASPLVLLALAVTLSAVLGCVMQHNAVVALLIPIFMQIALTVGANPYAFAVAIICCNNVCFLTPIGTGPVTMTLTGGYRFTDYTKAGLIPFVVMIVLAIVTIPMFYGL
ncbi:MAG: SLC13 family permease [Candidatus Scatomorpha sp.]|jgi:sodium-dependent dicarboxylate transporter 2/3/5